MREIRETSLVLTSGSAFVCMLGPPALLYHTPFSSCRLLSTPSSPCFSTTLAQGTPVAFSQKRSLVIFTEDPSPSPSSNLKEAFKPRVVLLDLGCSLYAFFSLVLDVVHQHSSPFSVKTTGALLFFARWDLCNSHNLMDLTDTITLELVRLSPSCEMDGTVLLDVEVVQSFACSLHTDSLIIHRHPRKSDECELSVKYIPRRSRLEREKLSWCQLVCEEAAMRGRTVVLIQWIRGAQGLATDLRKTRGKRNLAYELRMECALSTLLKTSVPC